MSARSARSPFYAAGLTAILAAALAGCTAVGSGGSASPATSASNAPSSSPVDAVKLAAKITGGASSFTGTLSVQGTAKAGASSSGDVSMTASMTEQLHPSLLAEIQIGSMSAGGQSLPGGMTELVTPSALYLKWAMITQELHTGKPWISVPVSALSKSTGVNLTQLFSEATSNSPLTDSQLLAAAGGVREVGTSTMDGVTVTEYEGTVPLDQGMQYLSGTAKTAMQHQLAASGLTTASFKVWIDSSHTMRKAIMTEDGPGLTEVITITVDSINQPVNIQIPAADQTTPLPASVLSGAGS